MAHRGIEQGSDLDECTDCRIGWPAFMRTLRFSFSVGDIVLIVLQNSGHGRGNCDHPFGASLHQLLTAPVDGFRQSADVELCHGEDTPQAILRSDREKDSEYTPTSTGAGPLITATRCSDDEPGSGGLCHAEPFSFVSRRKGKTEDEGLRRYSRFRRTPG